MIAASFYCMEKLHGELFEKSSIPFKNFCICIHFRLFIRINLHYTVRAVHCTSRN